MRKGEEFSVTEVRGERYALRRRWCGCEENESDEEDSDRV